MATYVLKEGGSTKRDKKLDRWVRLMIKGNRLKMVRTVITQWLFGRKMYLSDPFIALLRKTFSQKCIDIALNLYRNMPLRVVQ